MVQHFLLKMHQIHCEFLLELAYASCGLARSTKTRMPESMVTSCLCTLREVSEVVESMESVESVEAGHSTPESPPHFLPQMYAAFGLVSVIFVLGCVSLVQMPPSAVSS